MLCCVELHEVARDLGVPPGDLRAIEWDRLELLGNDRYAEKLLRAYEEWLAPDGVPRPTRAASR